MHSLQLRRDCNTTATRLRRDFRMRLPLDARELHGSRVEVAQQSRHSCSNCIDSSFSRVLHDRFQRTGFRANDNGEKYRRQKPFRRPENGDLIHFSREVLSP